MTGLGATRERTPHGERRRLSLLVRVAASAGRFSPKLADAVDQATEAELRVMADLVDRGMSVPALVSLLQGAHVVIGDEELYEAWIFPSSRRRMSSHHRTVDKRTTPDYGLDGPLVRESLHGKASVGTWVQLERTKATFQWGKLPSWHDLVHIRDFVIYRITGKNVGPWGLSAHVDTHPMVLRPPHSTPGRGAYRGLDVLAGRDLPTDEGTATRWTGILSPDVAPVGPVGDLYAPSRPARARDMLPDSPYADDLGPGLFGSLSIVRARARLSEGVRALIDLPPLSVRLEQSRGSYVPPVMLTVRGVAVATRAVAQPTGRRDDPLGLDNQEETAPMAAHPHSPASPDASSVDSAVVDSSAALPLEEELADIAELVATGPVDLGAYTQAEMAVVLGEAPALAGSSDEVLAEAVRSLAARGVLFRSSDDEVDVVGDLGLILALAPTRLGTLEVRRGHAGDPDQPWRWLITVLPQGVVAVDRIDLLGLHRLALLSVEGVADTVAERLLAGPARIPKADPGAVPASADDVRRVAAEASMRWQLIYRVPRPGGIVVAVEAHLLRTGPNSVYLLVRQPESEDFTRAAVDAATLRDFLVDMVRSANAVPG